MTPLITVASLIEAGMARLELCQTEFSDFGHSPLMSRDIKDIKAISLFVATQVEKNAFNLARLSRIAVDRSVAVLQSVGRRETSIL